jgi:hypothetical protein
MGAGALFSPQRWNEKADSHGMLLSSQRDALEVRGTGREKG